eukprot:2595714-Alexandrium_andersonii.AAC.1
MADSSPQGSFDWMMRTSVTVGQSGAVLLFRRAMELLRDPAGPGEVEAAQALASGLQVRCAPPCGIGSGRASAWHKLHAVLHSFRLESPSWQVVAEHVNGIVSWTTDLGVESYFPGLPRVSLRKLFPWIDRLGESEVFPGAPVEAAEFDFAPAAPEADLAQQPVAPSSLAAFDFAAEGGAVGSDEAMPPAADPPPQPAAGPAVSPPPMPPQPPPGV